ncbi:hypothetical protein DFH06DRAFT_1343561 [Mycena polygramma]|nr:hypothetical protein DFH06DRAFT_1350297 [Mycena polygramma]KAJ7615591.1 hypothetical protein DFH06DRAFT_1343561 [Mycena polygramma]
MAPIRTTSHVARPLPLERTFVGGLNRMLAETAAKTHFDINATDPSNPRHVRLYTLKELDDHVRRGSDPDVGLDCLFCWLPISAWGCGEYLRKGGLLIAKSLVCKACWRFCWENDRLDYLDLETNLASPPKCTCPPGSKACQDILTGCELHDVRAMTRAPRGVFTLVRPMNREEIGEELAKRSDKRLRDFNNASDARYEETNAKYETALQWEQDFKTTRVADFRMPPPSPPPTVVIRAPRPYVPPPPRRNAPMFPSTYDYAAAARQRAAKQKEDLIAKAWYSYLD